MHRFPANGAGRGAFLRCGGGARGETGTGKGFGESAPFDELAMGAFELFADHALKPGNQHHHGAGGGDAVAAIEPGGEFGVLREEVERHVPVEVGAVGRRIEAQRKDGVRIRVVLRPRSLADSSRNERKSPDSSDKEARATSKSRICVSREVERRALPSAMLAAAERAAMIIWSNRRPQGPIFRSRCRRQNLRVASSRRAARIQESSQ